APRPARSRGPQCLRIPRQGSVPAPDARGEPRRTARAGSRLRGARPVSGPPPAGLSGSGPRGRASLGPVGGLCARVAALVAVASCGGAHTRKRRGAVSNDTTLRIVVRGRVQGVGFRACVEDAAILRGVQGWVRNRRDGSVEAVLSGPAEAVAAVIA